MLFRTSRHYENCWCLTSSLSITWWTLDYKKCSATLNTWWSLSLSLPQSLEISFWNPLEITKMSIKYKNTQFSLIFCLAKFCLLFCLKILVGLILVDFLCWFEGLNLFVVTPFDVVSVCRSCLKILVGFILVDFLS